MNLEGTHIKVTVKVYKKKLSSFLLSNKLRSGAKLVFFGRWFKVFMLTAMVDRGIKLWVVEQLKR